jgi:hypothetical protein
MRSEVNFLFSTPIYLNYSCSYGLNLFSMRMLCILQTSMGDSFDEELKTGDLDDIFVKMKNSVESDPRQAAVWNILGLVLLRGSQLQAQCDLLQFLPLSRSCVCNAMFLKNQLLILCTLCRVLSQFCLISPLLLQTTWIPLRILLFVGIDRRFLLGSTVGSCWDRPSVFAGIDCKLQGELC